MKIRGILKISNEWRTQKVMQRRLKTKLEVYFTSHQTVVVNSIEKPESYLLEIYDKTEHTIEINYSDERKLKALFGDTTVRVTYKKRLSDKVYVADFETSDIEH